MSTLTEKDARERMAGLLVGARVLRGSIRRMLEDAIAQAKAEPPQSSGARRWSRLANHLGDDWDTAEELVDVLDSTLVAYEEGLGGAKITPPNPSPPSEP